MSLPTYLPPKPALARVRPKARWSRLLAPLPTQAAPHEDPKAQEALRVLLRHLGENPEREGLLDTPKRVLKSYQELFAGYRQDPAEILSRTFDEVSGYQELVLLKDIPFHSTCEHHMLPFHGTAHVAYLPGSRVVGLSKLARLVECYARRLQIQERLTRQVAEALMAHLDARGAAVQIQAQHGCMVCRGVRKDGAWMLTSAYEGELQSGRQREEFLALVRS